MKSYVIKTNEGRTFIVQENHPKLAAKRITDMGLKWDEIKLAGDDSGEAITPNGENRDEAKFKVLVRDEFREVVAVAHSRGFRRFTKEHRNITEILNVEEIMSKYPNGVFNLISFDV